MTLLGSLLIKYTSAKNASSQNLRGIEAWARRDRPVSTIWRYLNSAEPFCWCI
jgi:hypothetical protein